MCSTETVVNWQLSLSMEGGLIRVNFVENFDCMYLYSFYTGVHFVA